MAIRKARQAQDINADLTFNTYSTYSRRRKPKTKKRRRGFFPKSKRPDAIMVARRTLVPDLNKCFRHFYPDGLPDNEEGRKFAAYMAQAQITACYSGHWRREWLEENSPFADDEIESFLTMPSWLASGRFLGERLEIDMELREQLNLKYITPWDMTKAEFKQYQLDKKRRKDREAKAAKRRAEGRQTRQEWLAGSKSHGRPKGVSERTWRYRQSKQLPGCSDSLPGVAQKNLTSIKPTHPAIPALVSADSPQGQGQVEMLLSSPPPKTTRYGPLNGKCQIHYPGTWEPHHLDLAA
jgi:hypothetical protein